MLKNHSNFWEVYGLFVTALLDGGSIGFMNKAIYLAEQSPYCDELDIEALRFKRASAIARLCTNIAMHNNNELKRICQDYKIAVNSRDVYTTIRSLIFHGLY